MDDISFIVVISLTGTIIVEGKIQRDLARREELERSKKCSIDAKTESLRSRPATTVVHCIQSNPKFRLLLSPSPALAALIFQFVYKSPLYKTVSAKVARFAAIEDKAKKNLDTITAAKDSTKKQIDKATVKHKIANEQTAGVRAGLSTLSARFNMLGMAFQFFTYRYLSGQFSGRSIGRLPFEPFWPIDRFVHRGITSPSTHDMSWFFIYMLINFSLKSILKKFIGVLKGEDGKSGGMKDIINSPGMRKVMKRFGYKEEDFEGINEVLGMLPG